MSWWPLLLIVTMTYIGPKKRPLCVCVSAARALALLRHTHGSRGCVTLSDSARSLSHPSAFSARAPRAVYTRRQEKHTEHSLRTTHGTTHTRGKGMQRRHGQHKAEVNGVMIRREESW